MSANKEQRPPIYESKNFWRPALSNHESGSCRTNEHELISGTTDDTDNADRGAHAASRAGDRALAITNSLAEKPRFRQNLQHPTEFRIETRSAPAVLGATHRAFTFYLGSPISSILKDSVHSV
jgi:hypothetical protein